MDTDANLTIDHLGIAFDDGATPAVSDVSLKVAPGEVLALVGESGSGKSLTVRAILRLLPGSARMTGRIALGATDIGALSPADLARFRGGQVAMVFQDPLSSLNPVVRVGDAIAEVIRSHKGTRPRAARATAVELMRSVGIRDPERNARAYPHELSGGMRQRVMIAMALAAEPRMLLADEPTTALDVVVQANILKLLDDLRRRSGMGMIFVSHDLAVVAGICDRVAVMYAGQIVEEGPVGTVLRQPRMPYTAALLASIRHEPGAKRLHAIEGRPPPPGAWPEGCRFAPRCPLASDICRKEPVPVVTVGEGHWARCARTELTAPSGGPTPNATEAAHG